MYVSMDTLRSKYSHYNWIPASRATYGLEGEWGQDMLDGANLSQELADSQWRRSTPLSSADIAVAVAAASVMTPISQVDLPGGDGESLKPVNDILGPYWNLRFALARHATDPIGSGIYSYYPKEPVAFDDAGDPAVYAVFDPNDHR